MVDIVRIMKEVNGARELTIKSEQADSSHLLISVSDTGVGLAMEQVDRFLTHLIRLSLAAPAMGLPISRSIIKSHGSRLWAAANPGRGATFHVTLRIMLKLTGQP